MNNIKEFETLVSKHEDQLAAMMITYPNTNGEFQKNINEINDIIHKYGGLVYLHPDPPSRSGTTLYLKEMTYLDNIYNRLVLYKSNIEHEPTDNFGDDINNSRLVFTIFYDMA